MYFLVLNTGSSSIKFSIFSADDLSESYTGTLSGIGFDAARLSVRGKTEADTEVTAHDHSAAIQVIMQWLDTTVPRDQIAAIGHRIVHGGSRFSAPQLITNDTIEELRNLVPLDTAHLPAQIALIESVSQALPDVPQLACFDTAFFHELPTNARLLPLPRKLEAEGIRRYGFHGLSYTYLLEEFERVAGATAAQGKIIFAHLGNGASLAAVHNKQPIDTSMGLTPVGGVVMSTRSGDLDPGVLTYLAQSKGLSTEQLNTLVTAESGLLGISETTSDMKKLLDIELEDPRANDAIEIFCYQVRKYIGAYAAALGGINSLVFSGGIGEVSAPIRARVCVGLEFLGITLDDAKNQESAECISKDGASVGVHVLGTNEAAVIARELKQMYVNQ